MSTIDREEAIRIIASYPGPVDKSVVRRILTQMPDLPLPIKQKCTICPHCENCDVRDDGTIVSNWISVTKKLPEDDREVLITYADNDDGSPAGVDITTYGTFTFGSQPVKDYSGKPILKWRSPFPYFASYYHVTAWMELPKAYEGGEQDV